MKQFKIVIYYSDRDFNRKINGEVITDIETLLVLLNKRDYYKYIDPENSPYTKQVSSGEDFDYIIKNSFEGLDIIKHIDIEEYPTDTSIRIIGVDILHDIQNVLFENIYDSELYNIPLNHMALYPYTMKEFLNILSTNIFDLQYNNYNFVALKHS